MSLVLSWIPCLVLLDCPLILPSIPGAGLALDLCCISLSGTVGLKPCWGKQYPEAEVLGISKPGEGRRHRGVANASRGHRFSFLLLLFLWAGVKGREKSKCGAAKGQIVPGNSRECGSGETGRRKKRCVRTLEMRSLQPRAASATHSSQGDKMEN